jgi:hypothetical protein
LAPQTPVYTERGVATPVVEKRVYLEESDDCSDGKRKMGGSWGAVILIFIFVFIISFFLLYALNPTIIQNTNAAGNADGTPNAGKAVIGAIIIAIVFILLFWAFCSSNKW